MAIGAQMLQVDSDAAQKVLRRILRSGPHITISQWERAKESS